MEQFSTENMAPLKGLSKGEGHAAKFRPCSSQEKKHIPVFQLKHLAWLCALCLNKHQISWEYNENYRLCMV